MSEVCRDIEARLTGQDVRNGTSQSRALVALESAQMPPHAERQHPSALFLAQLIATADRAPQTCERRRAQPADAINLYTQKPGKPAIKRPSFSRCM